eukprot:CAMPEP_0203865404 /NCGR_PEP_ID=MMETSP0359-20131031/15342_1 /ASSEMBLY_ACC=CAM_ASM_000338 /TAXON_ID=268821 /ORGANISM="Scrippsiella Hangoei, Strain SHTV-5" /LENGTH=101 /DNA_ID=CAMNT_0050783327 /DNA_START=67 /DNA_END=373 /DNA_ORIENTATION=+
MGLDKVGELVLSSTGAVTSCDGDWGSDRDQIAASMWQMLRDVKQLMSPGESLKRVTVSFEGRDYVLTGKDGNTTSSGGTGHDMIPSSPPCLLGRRMSARSV